MRAIQLELVLLLNRRRLLLALHLNSSILHFVTSIVFATRIPNVLSPLQVLFNRRSVALYSQNNPAEPSLNRIARDIHLFAHKQLHLTGRIRKGNKDLKFDQLANAIRIKSGLPLLNILPGSLV